MSSTHPVITSYAEAPTKHDHAGRVTFAYRELGPSRGPGRLLRPPRRRPSTTGTPGSSTRSPRDVVSSPSTSEAWVELVGPVPEPSSRPPTTLTRSSRALGYDHDRRVLVLHGRHDRAGPRPQAPRPRPPARAHRHRPARRHGYGQGRSRHLLRSPAAPPVASDVKEFLFFNRDVTGRRAGEGVRRAAAERTADRDKDITLRAFHTQLFAIVSTGVPRPPTCRHHAADPHRQRRQRPHGPLGAVAGPAPAYRRVAAGRVLRLGPRRRLPVPRGVRPLAAAFLSV